MSDGIKLMPSDYGYYRPNAFTRFFIKKGQNIENNGRRFNRIIAGIYRKIAKLTANKKYIDCKVRGIRWRANYRNNSSEKKFFFITDYYDKLELDYILNLNSPKGVFLDIGANAGIYSLIAAKVFDEVHSFEPNEKMFDRLNFHIKINNLENKIFPHDFALSDTNGQATLSINYDNLGASCISNKGENLKPILTNTLQKFISDFNIKKIGGVKIDTEGHESQILMPFFKTVEERLFPKFIVIEFIHEKLFDEDLFSFLEQLGYREVLKGKTNRVMER